MENNLNCSPSPSRRPAVPVLPEGVTITEQQKRNFWSKVSKVWNRDGCWIWLGSRKKRRDGKLGYGQFKLAGRPLVAHRVAYLLATGRDPGACYVLHTCDNPMCVRPTHLRLGSHQDNMNDMIRKGRQGKKLTPDQVRAIRMSRGTQREVAARFGVSHRTIGHIWNRQTWATI